MLFRHGRRMYNPPYSGVCEECCSIRRCGEEREGVWPSKLCPRSVPAMEKRGRRRHRCWTTEEWLYCLCCSSWPVIYSPHPVFPSFCPLERVATATIAAHLTAQWSRKFKGDKGAIERKNHCKNWCKACFISRCRYRFSRRANFDIFPSFLLHSFQTTFFWKSSSSLLDSPSLSFLLPSLFFLHLLPP